MVKDTILYDRLEIKSNATPEEIKKNYFRLSKIWHPDKHQDENDKIKATQKIQEINEAKEILLDEQKRGLYNQIGMSIFENGNNNQHDDFNPFGSHFENMFGQHFPFGNMGNMGGNRNKEENEDLIEKINVTLEQLYNEIPVNFTYKYKSYCIKCNGEGYKNGYNPSCKSCDGKGMKVHLIKMGPMIQQQIVQCNVCNGSGKIVNDNNKCDQCNGNCYNYKEKTIQIPLKSGLTTENKINFSGKGHHYKNNKTNLIILINELPHDIFKRNNDDLFINIELKLYQALFGFNKVITHLDGRLLHINHTGKTEYNTIKYIQEEGMKSLNNNTKGNIYIKFTIKLPDINNMGLENKAILKTLLESTEQDECNSENNICNMEKLNKTKLFNCKQEQISYFNNFFNKINNSESEEEQIPSNNHHQHQNVQCAQQ